MRRKGGCSHSDQQKMASRHGGQGIDLRMYVTKVRRSKPSRTMPPFLSGIRVFVSVTALLRYVCGGRRPQYTVLKGRMSLQSGTKGYLKVILHSKCHMSDVLGGKTPGGWPPLLRGEAAED